jgi:hypothetical protein
LKTVIADYSVRPKFEPWEPMKRNSLGHSTGRIVGEKRKKKKKPPFTMSYEEHIEKLVKTLKGN